MTFAWTREKVAKLIALWKAGKTSPQMGAELGTTRNAVIGKLHRLNVKPGGRAKAPAVPADKTRDERNRQSARVAHYFKSTGFNPTPGVSLKPRKLKKTKWDDIDPKTPGLIRITDLKKHMCRWPLNNAVNGDFYFCGAQTALDKAYCTEHHAVAYIPKMEKKK
jgi:GcrA cell cycle regulator